MEYLYRLFDDGDSLLYAGITDDWTRRMREHWRTKPWAPDVLSIKLETYPDRTTVAAAELRAIRTEHPRYNIQHNHPQRTSQSAPKALTAEDVVVIGILLFIGGCIIYSITKTAVAHYREWKTDREEYLQWKHDREQLAQPDAPQQDDEPTQDTPPTPTPDTGVSPGIRTMSYISAPTPATPTNEAPIFTPAVAATTWPGGLAALLTAYTTTRMSPVAKQEPTTDPGN